MRILLVAPYRLEGAGGIATVVTRLQEALRARGHEALALLAGNSNRPTPAAGRPGTYRVYLRSAWPPEARLKGLLAFLAHLPLSLFWLSAFLRRQHVDVVHLHFPTPAALYFSALRPFSRWRLMMTFHGTDAYSLASRSAAYRVLLRLALGPVDLVVGVSRDLVAALRTAYPGLRTPAQVIHNGNPAVAAPAPEGPATGLALPTAYALAVGSLIPRKGYDVLLRAVRLARDRGHPIDTVIVGAGPGGPALHALASELQVDDLVTFAGEVPHAAIGPLYERARYFVHTAREEAFGLVLLEAMAHRRAVLATRVGGIPEFVGDGETGLLVEPDDPEALAEAMIRLDKDEALRDSLARKGQDLVTRDYSWERLTDQYVAAYSSVTAPRTGPA